MACESCTALGESSLATSTLIFILPLLNLWITLQSNMSPPEVPNPRKGLLQTKKRDYLRKVKIQNDSSVQIVEVAEDKHDEMYCPEWVRRAIMLLPITAAAAIYSGYRYWKLQFGQILFLRALGMDMNSRILFAMIDLILTGKYTLNSAKPTVPARQTARAHY